MKKREEEEELKRIENIPWIELTPLQRQKLVCWMDKEKEKEKAMAAVGIKPSTSSSSSGSKRKRKKRRKKKTPRASSHPSLRRAHCRQRQRYVLAGFAGYDTPCAVLPSIVNARGDSTGAFLGPGDMPVVILSGGFGQTVQKTADSPQLQSIAGRQHPLRAANADPHGPVCSADHGDSTVAAYFGGLCSCCAGSCRFSGAAVEKPLALPQLQLVEKSVVGLFWVMTSGNVPVFSAFWFYTGYMSTSVYGGLVSLVPRSCRQRQLVLLVSTHFALCFLLCSQALMSHIMAGMDQKDFFVAPQLQFVKVVPFPVVSQRPFPMVQPVWPTTEVSQLQFALGGRCPWYAIVQGFCAAAVHQRGRLHPCRCAAFIPWSRQLSDLGIPSCCTRWSTSLFPGRAGSLLRRCAEAVSYGPDRSSDHRDFAVAVRVGWLMSLLCGPTVLECRRGRDS